MGEGEGEREKDNDKTKMKMKMKDERTPIIVRVLHDEGDEGPRWDPDPGSISTWIR